jgi:hypothetical protein
MKNCKPLPTSYVAEMNSGIRFLSQDLTILGKLALAPLLCGMMKLSIWQVVKFALTIILVK